MGFLYEHVLLLLLGPEQVLNIYALVFCRLILDARLDALCLC